MNRYAEQLFRDDRFVASKRPRYMRVATISVGELGLPRGAVYADICTYAARLGLVTAPLELAVWLRLAMTGPSHRRYLHVASAAKHTDDARPNGFYLRHYRGRDWLRGYRASPDWIHASEETFVFKRCGGRTTWRGCTPDR